MTINSEIRDQAYQFFIEEAPELLQEIESGILTLRQARDTAKVHSIMRAAHSLKGSSASVGLDAIKTIAHRLETLFKALYSDTIEINEELETRLLEAFDCLRLPLMEQLASGQFDDQQALAVAEPIFSQLETQYRDAIAATSDFLPTSEELGMSMAQSIFEVDVAEGLERLAAVLQSPDGQEVAGELRAQADVFIGFAELLNLPGFGAIAEASLQALEQHPDQAVEVAHLALADFQAGREAVLAGENTQGGAPSPALLALAAGESAPMTASEEIEPQPLLDMDWASDEVAALLHQLGEAALPLQNMDDIDEMEGVDEECDRSLTAAEIRDADAAALEALVLGEETPVFDGFTPSDEAPEAPIEAPIELPTTTDLAAIFPVDDLLDAAISPEAGEQEAPANPSESEAQDHTSLQTTVPSEDPPQPLGAEAASSLTPPPQASTQAPVVTGLTVRVEAERLNRMNNLLGELTINRNGAELQNSQLRNSVKDLLSRFNRFQAAVEKLRELSDQMLIAPERWQQVGKALADSSPDDRANYEAQFDSLEMDSYSQLYSQTQMLLEDIVQLEEAVEDISLFSYQSEQLLGRHRKMLSQMQDELQWARMIPLGEVLNRFPRLLRDLSTTYQKPVHLNLTGTDILVDKAVLTKLYDPLVQLLRNSFDHGIEPVEIRQQQGKPEVGQIEIRARYQGRQVIIEVRDDGQGLKIDHIRQRVIELGWLTEAEANIASEEQLKQFIFEPGFSTARQVSELSGRGVGLDIVQAQIRALNGSIAVASTPGGGTTFTLKLPLTLTIINLLICFVGSAPLAIRSDSIQEILVPTSQQIRRVGQQQWLTWRDQEIPFYSLSDLLSYHCLIPEVPPSRVLATVPTPTNWEAPMLVLTRNNQAFALRVDRLVTEQELVVKPFGHVLKPPVYAYGCTVLGDGSLVPVIDGPTFLDDMVNRGLASLPDATETDALTALIQQKAQGGDEQADLQMMQATTVLVVDDAVTLRRTLALSLERAGYHVLQARDGQEALEQLEQSQAVQLVICDVEMPNMNGFEFLTKRRENPQIANIPVVMLTSRGNDKHRWLAMRLGATDYFTKPYLEQQLLNAIATHIANAEPAIILSEP